MTKRMVCWLALSIASSQWVACSDGDGTNHGDATAGQGGTAAGSGAGATSGAGAGGAAGMSSPAGSGGSVAGSDGGAGADGGTQPGDGGEPPEPGDPGTVIAEPDDEANYVFDPSELRTYDLIIAQTDLDTLNMDPRAEVYVQGMLEHDGMQYGPVGIRYKGSAGAFQPPCTGFGGAKMGKCSMKVAFDFVDDEARFHGLKKLNFHSMNADASMLRERLVYAMFRENGIAAPRAVHARVLINGQLEGLFAVIEQPDSRFTRSRFSEGGKGNLYKEVWPMHDDAATYLTALETNRDEMPSAQRMIDLKNAIAEGEDAAAAFLDRDYVLRYLAADRVTINDDGVMHWWCTPLGQGNNPGGVGNHNYYWYEAETADHFWLIPWDADMALSANFFVGINPEWREPGSCACGGGGFSSTAAVCDPLINAWAGWRDDYEAAVDAFLDGPFSEANVTAKLDAWSEQIDPVVQESEGTLNAATHSDWLNAVQNLRATVNSARSNRGTMY